MELDDSQLDAAGWGADDLDLDLTAGAAGAGEVGGEGGESEEQARGLCVCVCVCAETYHEPCPAPQTRHAACLLQHACQSHTLTGASWKTLKP